MGVHSITAGDATAGDTGFTRAAATVLVNAAPASRLHFTLPPTSVTVGQPFPLTVLVTDAYGNRIRTGTGSSDTVAISGTSLICLSGTTLMASGGAATFAGCTLSTPPSVTLTATDTTSGDTTFTLATTVITVVQASTHVTLKSSANPGKVGTPITYTAKVISTAPSTGVPWGQVVFYGNGQLITGCVTTLVNGSVSCTTTYLLLTVQTIVAKYLGTSGYAPSTSPTLTETLVGNGLALSESASGTNPSSSNVNLSPVSLNGSAVTRTSGGSLNVVHVTDDRGTQAGWTVTGQLQGNFYNGTPSGNPSDNVIPANRLLWSPSVATGSAGGVVAGPASALSKTGAKVLCSSPSGHGAGKSSCTATLKLAVPPNVAAGRYTAVLDIVVS